MRLHFQTLTNLQKTKPVIIAERVFLLQSLKK